jgi:LmbE family N-acetylglucosaminyl deacetylase
MVITAHPDDAEFYLGGTLTKLGRAGVDIQLVACTDGDKGYYPFEDYKRNRKVRQAEQTEAAKVWHGRRPVFLGFPDGRLSVTEPLVRALEMQMESFSPDYVFAFDGRYPPRLSHRDHRRAGIAAENACYRYKKAGWLMRFSTNSANWYSDISDLWDEKYALLQVHASQFHGKRLDGVAAMVYDSAERDGQNANTTLAEGLRCEPNPGR